MVLAIDQGGHSSRALVFDRNGQLVTQARCAVKVSRPHQNWVEQDAREVVQSVQYVVDKALHQLGDDVRHISCAAMATQRSSVACWDRRDGRALSALISWQDRRADQWLRRFSSQEQKIQQKTGLLLSPHYGASKLRWCLDHLEAVKKALEGGYLAFGPMASFLNFSMTEEKRLLVDPANASRTLLWNLGQRQWDSWLLELFGVPPQALPQSVASVYDFGQLHSEVYSGIPLGLMNGDQSAALFAHGLPQQGTAYINMGTGAFLQVPTGDEVISAPGILSGIVLQKQEAAQYVLECTVNGAGSALTQVGQDLGIDKERLEAQLANWLKQATNPPLFLNGISGLGAPFWEPDFRSRFVGQGQAWEKMVAVAESILFLLKVNLDQIQTVLDYPLERIMLTGGLAMNDELCQGLADLSGLTVKRPGLCEATAKGAAFLAASCPQLWEANEPESIFEPQSDPGVLARFDAWLALMQEALGQTGHGMSNA